MKHGSKSTQIIEPKIKAMIFGHGKGWVFTPRDFSPLGSARSIGMALTRLSRKGVVRKLACGLYDFPMSHPTLGQTSPSADLIAQALVRRDSVRLQPAGAYAANVLGLSEQVPSKVVFLTDGPTRHVKLGKREIWLKRTTPRNMATAGRMSGTVIQALRYLGQENVDDHIISILKRRMTVDDHKLLLKDLRYAPTWVAEIMRRVAGGEA